MKFDTVSGWLDWQTQIHHQAIDLGLDRIRPVFSRLIHSPLAKKIIVVAGTNGKGSTVAFLESLYVAGGYQVGTYTSPHLISYNERIRLGGEPVNDQILCEAFDHVEMSRQDAGLTYFEFGTLAALDVFQHEELDIVILEVGLGGRLDAVNLIDADIAIVTNTEMDHMDWLGDSREKIAMEKFGIARSDKPIIYGDEDLVEVARQYCSDNNVRLYQLGYDFGSNQQHNVWQWRSTEKSYHSLPMPGLTGEFQLKNASSALMVVSLLELELPLSMSQIRLGLSSTLLPGRFQITQFDDNIQICDVAHNPHSVNAFIANLQKLPKIGNHHIVFGMLEDKAIDEVIKLLKPHIDQWHVCSINENRGLSSDQLKQHLSNQGIDAQSIDCFESASHAYNNARSALQSHDKLLVLGSFYVVAEIMSSV